MVSIELLLPEKPAWKKNADMLELTAMIQVLLNGKPLPEPYFKGGVEINLYETTFEMLDLLGHLEKAFMNKGKVPDALYQAELCYTANFFTVQPASNGMVKVAIRFNPASVDDEHLLAGAPDYQEQVPFATLATEILLFAISVFEALVEFNPAFEEQLVDLQNSIYDHQERLEKDFKIILPALVEEK
jgi:hypothetical protein